MSSGAAWRLRFLQKLRRWRRKQSSKTMSGWIQRLMGTRQHLDLRWETAMISMLQMSICCWLAPVNPLQLCIVLQHTDEVCATLLSVLPGTCWVGCVIADLFSFCVRQSFWTHWMDIRMTMTGNDQRSLLHRHYAYKELPSFETSHCEWHLESPLIFFYNLLFQWRVAGRSISEVCNNGIRQMGE